MDFTEFVFKQNEKILRELANKTWQMESAKEKLAASKVSRSGKVKTHFGQWWQCTKEVLLLNGTDTFQFVTNIKDLLIHGRGEIETS